MPVPKMVKNGFDSAFIFREGAACYRRHGHARNLKLSPNPKRRIKTIFSQFRNNHARLASNWSGGSRLFTTQEPFSLLISVFQVNFGPNQTKKGEPRKFFSWIERKCCIVLKEEKHSWICCLARSNPFSSSCFLRLESSMCYMIVFRREVYWMRYLSDNCGSWHVSR